MGLIPQIKCSRCDRNYSALRARCPYCGARRRKKGKRVSDTDNSTWKLIIGVLLIVVLIAAVVVLLVTSMSDNGDSGDENTPPEDDNPISSNEGVTQLPGTDPDGDTDTPGNTDDPSGDTDPNGTTDPDGSGTSTDPGTQETAIDSIAIHTTYNDKPTEDFSMNVGETVSLSCATTPDVDLEELDLTPEWSSSDENVFVVLSDGTVTGTGEGNATLTLTLGDLTAECIVRVRAN